MPDRHTPRSLRGVRVLILENNFSVARSLKVLLESYGCEITGMAASVSEGLELVTDAPFDVVVLDIQLQGGDASPIAARIREQDGRAIYITGYGDVDMLPPELRSFPRLAKPFDPNRLVSMIQQLVSGAERS